MAPVAPLGRAGAIALVEAGRIPFSFGSPHPCVACVEEEGVVRIRALVIDEAQARAASENALRRGQPWMPEHHYALGRPTGTIYAEAPTREALVEIIRTMSWPSHW